MERRHGREKVFMAAAAILLVVLLGADLATGGIRIPLREIAHAVCGGECTGPMKILLSVRLPRVLSAFLAGASLALSGAQMQSIFRNPLADPHIMGISSGAGLGAAIATMALPSSIAAGISGLTIAAAACTGAAAVSAAILAFSSWIRNPSTLLICGIMTGFIINAVISVIQYSAGAESLRLFYNWSAGSFTGNDMTGITIMACMLAAGILLSVSGHKGLDIILFGDEYAALSGARPTAIRFNAILGSALMTGAVTAFCGPIGFVGIVAPHIVRRLTGTAVHRIVLPGSILTGGILGTAADMVSQNCGLAVPAGSMMAIIGIPFILAILAKGAR